MEGQNEISHYESLKKQDTANRKLIKKLQLDKQALKEDIQSKDYLYNTNIAFRLLNGDFNPLRKEIKLSSDKVNEFVERYKDLLIELTNEL